MLFDLFGTLVHYDAGRVSQSFPETYQFLQGLTGPTESPDYNSFLAQTERVFGELDAWSQAEQREFSMQDFAKRLLRELGVEATSNLLDQFSDLYGLQMSQP